ncbi:MAG: carbon storage regulator [Planctomycetia bacterium]|nr:carbon storage regulator [Planctomycetia bacterium]
MLVLTRKNRESVVIGRPEDQEMMLEITILDIEGGRVRLGFEADTKMPIHRREVWDRICNGNGNGAAPRDPVKAALPPTTNSTALPAARTDTGPRQP